MRDTSIVAVRGGSSNGPAAGSNEARECARALFTAARRLHAHTEFTVASAQAQPTRIPFHASRIIFDTANYRSISYLSCSFDQIC